jgi:hypothetical protein
MANTSVQAPSKKMNSYLLAGNTLIQSGSYQKSATGQYTVDFSQSYASSPVVVLTPFWNGQNSNVGYVETLDTISSSGFTASSSNYASNYFVEWIAIGAPATTT